MADEQMQELMREARLVADIAVQWPVSDSHISVAPCVMFPSDESLGALNVISAFCEAGIWRWSSPPAAWYVADPRESLFAMPVDVWIAARPACFMGAQEHGWVLLDEGRRVPVDRLLPLDLPEWDTEKDKGTHGFPSRASPKACGGGARLRQRICPKASSCASTGPAYCSPFVCGLSKPYVKQEKGCRGRVGGRTRGRAARPDADVCENTSEFDASLRGRRAR